VIVEWPDREPCERNSHGPEPEQGACKLPGRQLIPNTYSRNSSTHSLGTRSSMLRAGRRNRIGESIPFDPTTVEVIVAEHRKSFDVKQQCATV
jgi:hypothetical protein